MKLLHISTGLLLILSLGLFAKVGAKKPTWTDPETAATDNPDFKVQGEYQAEGIGVQVVALGDGKFQAQVLNGGLPGAGWDGEAPMKLSGETDNGKTMLQGENITATIRNDELRLSNAKLPLKRVVRMSPTLGKAPPAGAAVLFDGKTNGFTPATKVDNGLLTEGVVTADSFGSFELHLEFRTPFKPFTQPGSQDRGNSGVYIYNNYETQVLDSFGIKPEHNFCGSLYKFKVTDVNMCLPPLSWQTYDIHFTAPVFEDGKKVKNARITTFHNGVRIHDDVELPKGTGAGGGRPEKARGQIHLQGHGNPVRYRNIWLLEK